ncbi:hypothetical protein Aperf_G00000069831 [Anoplocephala perfoliata]
MEPPQRVPAPQIFDAEMSDSDLRRWLLRLKYSAMLRRRLASAQITRRSPMGKCSNRTPSCLHIKVLLGLAASAYFLAKDNEFNIDSDGNDLQCKLTSHELKAILRHRGISAESFFEKKDLEVLSSRTGPADEVEYKSALASDAFMTNLNSTCDKEAVFFRGLTSSQFSSQQHRLHCNGENDEIKSVIFDSAGLFVDRIEDNKESVWILSIVKSETSMSGIITPAIWTRLVKHFSPISINFGVLICDKLDSEYGFTPSILVIVLPTAYPNHKHSVEFRRLSLAHAPPCNDVTLHGRKSCLLLLDHVTTLLQNVLAKRVAPLHSLSQLHQQQKYTRLQSLNVIWIPGERFCEKFFLLSGADNQIFTRPPLSFSILSINYLGRAAFWRLDSPRSPVSTQDLTQEVSPHTPSLNNVLHQLGCPTHTGPWNGNSRYVLLTPEGYCFVQNRLSFKRLDNLLRWNYPSSNNLFIFGLISINALLIVTALFQSLLIFARFLNFSQLLSNHLAFLFKRGSSKTLEYDEQCSNSPLKVRAKLITTVVKATFIGWKNYTPSLAEDADNTASSSSSAIQRIITFAERILKSLFGIVFKLFLANLLFLLAALPIVNFMGHALPLAGILLLSLRSIVYWFDLAAIIPTYFTALLVFKIILFAVVFVFILDGSARWTSANLAVRWPRSSPSQLPPQKVNPFVAKLYKMKCAAVALDSPALLARYLVLSDDEFSLESPQQSSSSISDGEFHREPSSETASLGTFEAARLYRKAIELDRAVTIASKKPHLSWQSAQNLILRRLCSSGPNFPAKLFVWKFTASPVLSSKTSETRPSKLKPKSASPRFAVKSRSTEEDKWYEAGSESDRSPQAAITSSTPGRHRRARRGVNLNTEPRLQWPTWVITCEECVICWREFECDTIMAALSCGHAFHAECLKSWLDVGRDVCPVCRWPAHLSHIQREKHLICQLIRSLRGCLRTTRSTSSTSSTEPEICPPSTL